jgi:hypothetical protein
MGVLADKFATFVKDNVATLFWANRSLSVLVISVLAPSVILTTILVLSLRFVPEAALQLTE